MEMYKNGDTEISLLLRGTTVPKQSRCAPPCHCEARRCLSNLGVPHPVIARLAKTSEAIWVRGQEIATHPAGARNDRME